MLSPECALAAATVVSSTAARSRASNPTYSDGMQCRPVHIGRACAAISHWLEKLPPACWFKSPSMPQFAAKLHQLHCSCLSLCLMIVYVSMFDCFKCRLHDSWSYIYLYL